MTREQAERDRIIDDAMRCGDFTQQEHDFIAGCNLQARREIFDGVTSLQQVKEAIKAYQDAEAGT